MLIIETAPLAARDKTRGPSGHGRAQVKKLGMSLSEQQQVTASWAHFLLGSFSSRSDFTKLRGHEAVSVYFGGEGEECMMEEEEAEE